VPADSREIQAEDLGAMHLDKCRATSMRPEARMLVIGVYSAWRSQLPSGNPVFAVNDLR
jgi:hypothetical protein